VVVKVAVRVAMGVVVLVRMVLVLVMVVVVTMARPALIFRDGAWASSRSRPSSRAAGTWPRAIGSTVTPGRSLDTNSGSQGFDLFGLQAIGPADQHQIGRHQLVVEQVLNGAEVVKAGVGQPLGFNRRRIPHHVALGQGLAVHHRHHFQ
jgi:hypothetical protein